MLGSAAFMLEKEGETEMEELELSASQGGRREGGDEKQSFRRRRRRRPHFREGVGAVLNLESTGADGPHFMFQHAGAFPLRARAKGSSRPRGTVIAQDFFDAGLSPAATDFECFCSPSAAVVAREAARVAAGSASSPSSSSRSRLKTALLERLRPLLLRYAEHVEGALRGEYDSGKADPRPPPGAPRGAGGVPHASSAITIGWLSTPSAASNGTEQAHKTSVKQGCLTHNLARISVLSNEDPMMPWAHGPLSGRHPAAASLLHANHAPKRGGHGLRHAATRQNGPPP